MLKLYFHKFILFLDNVTTKDFGSKNNILQYSSSSAAQFFDFQADVIIHTIPPIQKSFDRIFDLKVYPYLERLFGIRLVNSNKFRVKCYDNLICLDSILDVQVDHDYQFVIRKYPDENVDDGLIKIDLLLNDEVVHSKKINQTDQESILTMRFEKNFFSDVGYLENIRLLSFNKTETKDIKCDPGILTFIHIVVTTQIFSIYSFCY